MQTVDAIIAKLTVAQRAAVRGWRWKGWVSLERDTTQLAGTGLIDVQRFPQTPSGKRKCKLNEVGQAVRVHLAGKANA